MIVSINPIHFFKCQRSIERSNLTNPSPKILVMDGGLVDPTSHISGLLLRSYYQKLEQNPKLGISDQEYSAIVKNNKDSEGKITCVYCKNKFTENEITLDHFKPKVFKGANQFFNIKLACQSCNESKGAIYPTKMPKTFSLYLQKMQAGIKTNCLNILTEAKDTLIVDEVEQSLMNRIISMELKWRKEWNAKKTKKVEDELIVA